jgi:hypothetical protein
MGRPVYRKAKRLLITADAGGSNGPKVRLWKAELQKFADEIRLPIMVSHFPPGTSKWNKIEPRGVELRPPPRASLVWINYSVTGLWRSLVVEGQ